MEVVPDFQSSGSKVRLGVWFADKLNRQMRDSAEELRLDALSKRIGGLSSGAVFARA